jgi:hypothetical protein
VIAAITGKNGSFIKKKSTLSASAPSPTRGKKGPIAVNTRIETSATITRNVVPQRGCRVVLLRAFSTVSG